MVFSTKAVNESNSGCTKDAAMGVANEVEKKTGGAGAYNGCVTQRA